MIARRAAAKKATSAESVASTTYVETSALLAALLEQDAAAQQAMRTKGRRVTSALTLAEAHRGVIRARVSGRLTAEQERLAIRALRTFARRCDLVAVTDAVLERAGRPFPVEPIRTLDAIHLATADALGDSPQLITILTRDVRVRDNAHALGFATAYRGCPPASAGECLESELNGRSSDRCTDRVSPAGSCAARRR